jgi:bacteriorhodopsin
MYNPLRPLNMPKMLGREFGKELLLALLAVFLLAQTRIVSFVGRVGFVTVVGLIAASSTNVSYWIWYAFPKRYTAAYMLIDIIAFLLVGVVAALIFPKRDTSEIS